MVMSKADSKNCKPARPTSAAIAEMPNAQAMEMPTTSHTMSLGPTWKKDAVAPATTAAVKAEKTTAVRKPPRLVTELTNGIGARVARVA